MSQPVFYLLAGPNGAGKSTLYRAALSTGLIPPEAEFVNADLHEAAHLQHIAHPVKRSQLARQWADRRRADCILARCPLTLANLAQAVVPADLALRYDTSVPRGAGARRCARSAAVRSGGVSLAAAFGYSAAMSDESQIEIPPSFLALYTAPGRQKPSLPRAELSARYELCEDMAQMLTETARNMQFGLGITEADVLARCAQGLRVEPVVVNEAESAWVVCRLAELLDWPQPGEGAPPA